MSQAASTQCVILAGGLGTRMYPLSSHTPKTLLEVNGRPFAHYQLSWLRRTAVSDVVYCIGHMGDRIRDAIGDGASFGLRVRYCDEGPELLGTAGALRLAIERELLDESFLVTYGDSFLRIDFGAVLAAFRAQPLPALMVVHRNEGRWDKSNVRLAGARVDLYDKRQAEGFDHIDYGLGAFKREIFEGLPVGSRADLSDIYHRLSIEGRLAAHVAQNRFFEIGSHEGMAELSAWLRTPEGIAACPT